MACVESGSQRAGAVTATAEVKRQAPTSKHQRNTKIQTPNTNKLPTFTPDGFPTPLPPMHGLGGVEIFPARANFNGSTKMCALEILRGVRRAEASRVK
jgi:hypothetical protein